MSARVNDWQLRLAAEIESAWRRPFEWGTHDCVLFAARCVEAVTGENHNPGWRDQYSTEREAYRVLQGYGGIRKLAAAHLGEEIAPTLAQPGDIGLFQEGKREALCVQGGGVWLAPAERGLTSIEPGTVITAWRVTRG